MQRDLIQFILDKIAAELPQFKTVDLFNDQFNKQDNAALDSFRFPALFVSFPEGANYENYTSGVQHGLDIRVRFYIADELTKSRLSIGKTVLEVLDLKQDVFKVFHGSGAAYIKSFLRIYEETDESRRNYYVFIQDYNTGIIDASKYIDQGDEHTLTLDLTSQVIIKPVTDNNIRTAKDVNDTL
jgi:hypothetical protein